MSATAFPQPVSGPRLLPLGLIVLLHAGLLYAALHGMQRPAVTPTVPREVIATFITPQPAPEPQPRPTPPAPQPVPRPAPRIAQKPAPVVSKASPSRPTPAPALAPSEKAISTPAPPPVAAAPAAPEPQAAAAPAAPPAPPAPAAPAPPKTVSGVEYLQPPQPDYPPIARRNGEEGKVMLRVLVDNGGRPEKVDVQKSSGYARLDEAARQAALRARFKPHVEDGKPVAVYALIPINFSIQ